MGGTLLTDLGLIIKRHFKDGTMLPVGYTNGMITYLHDSRVIHERGYEAFETIYFSPYMPGPWDEKIEEVILGGFDELLKQTRQF